MSWQLIIEDFSPKLIHIKGFNNIVADALSRLDKIENLNNINSDNKKVESFLENQSETFALKKEDDVHYPAHQFQNCYEITKKVKSLIEIAKAKPNDYSIEISWVE